MIRGLEYCESACASLVRPRTLFSLVTSLLRLVPSLVLSRYPGCCNEMRLRPASMDEVTDKLQMLRGYGWSI